MNKRILGLDLGTNSIGWALVEQNFENKYGKILGMGSRILPMSQDEMGKFEGGAPIKTGTAERTKYRSVRRLRERYLLRRERLHRVLNVLGYLPEHYAAEIDFKKQLGKFKGETEPKLVYKPVWNEEKQKQEYEFVFKKSFEEMLADFRQHQPQILIDTNGNPALIPYDWTIYYLRKKALSKKIEKEELAWILLNFNQKRGYYQLRGEEDEDATRTAQTRIYFDTQVIAGINDTGAVYKGLKVIQITLANGDGGKYFSKEIPNWIGLQKNVIATIDLDKDGNDKYEDDGTLKRRFSIPTEEDWDKKWKLVKIKTEKELDNYIKDLNIDGATLGAYIYDALLQNAKQKIKGKLVRTIERKFYKDELRKILEKQKEFHNELQSEDLYNDCVRELYRNNDAHQLLLSKKNICHLFVEDIIFYQRPLRSKKSSIGNCTLEFRPVKNKDGNLVKDANGKQIVKPLKVTPKSNPYYQEFRIWQWMYNLSIYRKDDDTKNVTSEFIQTTEDWEKLFDFLMTQKEVNHKDILTFLITPIIKSKFPDAKAAVLNKEIAKEISIYRWNYVFDDLKEKEEEKSKKYPANETGYEIRKRLSKVDNIPADFLTRETEQNLWHIIYSVTDKEEYKSALKSFAAKHHLDEKTFVEAFVKILPFKNDYGSFSEKAIKKLLPLMRKGKHWNEDTIVSSNKIYLKNINALLQKLDTKEKEISQDDRDEWNKAINTKLYNELKEFLNGDPASFQGLRLHIAQYLVYGRHSEAAIAGKWNSPDDLKEYLKDFKQHSLRNPIVEQVITETLRVVKDIWDTYGNGAKDFFSEIHVELGREMKNTKDERERLSRTVTENENTNLRIKTLLAELLNHKEIKDVRPHSPYQQEALKIFEEYALNNDERYDENQGDFVYDPITEDIEKISKLAQPSKSELLRYKLWLEQRYRSPYTGAMIPLSRLFTTDYQIEHIIPQSRYFDDSFSNKVICESAVNELKDNLIGLEFIKQFHGQKVSDKVSVFEVKDYEDFVKQHYTKNRGKRNKLLMEEIPEKMIERQMNDTRYISKFITSLLSNIVREEKNDDAVNSKNIIPGNGKITTELKQDWGLNDVWNELVLPRFERMNQLTNSTVFTAWSENHQKFLPTVPLELSKKFSKKRIDHRHHAMDALVVACATRDHVNLLNNQSARSATKRYDLQNKLRGKKPYFNKKHNKQRDAFKKFFKPWDTFTQDARTALESLVVSFKQNLRVINKATNYYESYKDENGDLRIGNNGKPKKDFISQKQAGWAVRKPMHEATVSGIIKLSWAKSSKGEFITATRKALDSSFSEENIRYVTDTGIQKILHRHLQNNGNDPERAFSPEGIEKMNINLPLLNNGKMHQPILKVRVFEVGKGRFPLGETANKKDKFVQGSPNLYYAVFLSNNKRYFKTIPFDEIIEHQKWKANLAKAIFKHTSYIPISNDGTFLFSLSPGDLVYVPTAEEVNEPNAIDFSNLSKPQIDRLYNVNDFSSTCYFSPNRIAKAITSKEVDLKFDTKKKKLSGSFDTKTASLDGVQIKDVCMKLIIDRLGNITLPQKW